MSRPAAEATALDSSECLSIRMIRAMMHTSELRDLARHIRSSTLALLFAAAFISAGTWPLLPPIVPWFRSALTGSGRLLWFLVPAAAICLDLLAGVAKRRTERRLHNLSNENRSLIWMEWACLVGFALPAFVIQLLLAFNAIATEIAPVLTVIALSTLLLALFASALVARRLR